MSITTKNEPDWNLLKNAIKILIGFDPNSYNTSFLERRVQVRMHALKILSYSEYSTILRNNSKERELLLKELTIHVTSFFRDEQMWKELTNKVIPAIAEYKRKNGLSTINVWSAGCSSGEEPVSIAICFKEALKDEFKSFKIRIIGTDYDAETVRKAKLAEYELMQFKEMPKTFIEKYFIAKDSSTYKPIPEILSIINYERDDILSNKKPSNIDLILCRNTVIYFDTPTKSKLYLEFFECLNNHGFFILGKTEILQGLARDKFYLYDSRERIVQKLEDK